MALINMDLFRDEMKFKITIYENNLSIINYDDIPHFSTEKIMIKHQNKTTVIKGKNLVVSKLMKKEVLITGEVKEIELR